MFNLGLSEIIVILIVALVVLGPEELPKAARTIAKTIKQLRQNADEIKQSILEDIPDSSTENDKK